MYLIKRKNDNHYSYAFEPTDRVVIINAPALKDSGYGESDVCTVIEGRPRHMPRTDLKNQVYRIQNNEPNDYPCRVASWEIAPEIPLTPDEYKVLINEWEKNQMINLLLQGVRNEITD